MIRLYQVLLFPLAKPTALVLNRWLGKEVIQYVREDDLIALLELQKEKEGETQISEIESRGMINFARLDKVRLSEMGTLLDLSSVVELPTEDGNLLFPGPRDAGFGEILEKIRVAPRKWLVITDESGAPVQGLNTEALLKAMYQGVEVSLEDYCSRPLVFRRDDSVVAAIRALQDQALGRTPEIGRICVLWSVVEKSRRIITNLDLIDKLAEGITYSDNRVA